MSGTRIGSNPRRMIGIALASVVLAAVVATRVAVRGTAEAGEFSVTGVVGPEVEDARITVDDGISTYNVISAIDLEPFFGRVTTLHGDLDGYTLTADRLTLGTIDVTVEGASPQVKATGLVEQVADEFTLSAEGITFTVSGSDALSQLVGVPASVAGELTQATLITLTELSNEEGQKLPTDPPADESFIPTNDVAVPNSSWEDDG